MKPEFPSYNLRFVITKLRKLYDSLENPTDNEKINLDSAVDAIGYSSFINGAARNFLLSARLYGLIEYDTREFTLNFTPLGQQALKTTVDFETMRKVFLTPKLFSKLDNYFKGDLNVYLKSAVEICGELNIDGKERHALAKSYCSSLWYIRDLFSDNAQLKERKSIHNERGDVSILYTSIYCKAFLKEEIDKMLINFN